MFKARPEIRIKNKGRIKEKCHRHRKQPAQKEIIGSIGN